LVFCVVFFHSIPAHFGCCDIEQLYRITILLLHFA
jgi:hypothetical protein